MRLGILGAGAAGTGLAALLAFDGDIETIALAGRDRERVRLAERQVGGLGGPVELTGAAVDASDPQAVAAWAADLDAVLNATLPHLNLTAMRGCLAAGTHYMDLSSGPFEVPGKIPYEETLDAQFELDAEFQTADLTAISCAGVAPGWVDLVARRAVEELDSVRSIVVRWVERNDASELFSTVGTNMIANFNMPTPLRWLRGEVTAVDLFESEEVYDWPELGPIPVFTGFMHPELRTMHFLGVELERVEVKSGLSNGRWRSSPEIWIEALRRRLGAGEEIASDLATEFGRAFIPPERTEEAIRMGILSEGAFAACVEVIGTRGGEEVTSTEGLTVSLAEARERIPWGTHTSYATSGTTPVVLLPMLGRDEISTRGVVGVGALPEWEAVLAKVDERGLGTWKRLEAVRM
jgi:saccharopine dehydrogenase-like NADP-dependent oxidoreductase